MLITVSKLNTDFFSPLANGCGDENVIQEEKEAHEKSPEKRALAKEHYNSLLLSQEHNIALC